MFEYFTSRFTLQELSGALGDLGTFLPIIVGMSAKNVINIGSAFFWTGLFNIITGYLWDAPICVQPMKTIASASIAGNLDSYSVVTSGFLTGIIVFGLGITNMIQTVANFIPSYLISAIQLGQGLIFITQGIKMIVDVKNWTSHDSYIISIMFGIMILFTWCPWNHNSHNKWVRTTAKIAQKTPSALIMFIIGCIIASQYYPGSLYMDITNPFHNSYSGITNNDYITGLTQGTIPQLPLTLLNSVLSVVELNNELFPEKLLTIREMAVSVGLMNIVGVWFGSVPNCHGSGGLSGQYKFGARNGLSVIMLGFIKCFVGLFLGSILTGLITVFPKSILGLMLTVSGGELASRGTNKIIDKDDIIIHSIVVGIMISINLYTGFLAGLIVHIIKMMVLWINKKYDIELLINERI